LLSSTNIVNFYVCEFLIAFITTLPSITALTYATWWEGIVWFYKLVDEAHSTSYLVNNLLTVFFWKYLPSESIFALIGKFYSMFLISCNEESENWTKHLLIINLLTFATFYHCYRVKGFLNVFSLPINLVTFWKFFDLFIQQSMQTLFS